MPRKGRFYLQCICFCDTIVQKEKGFYMKKFMKEFGVAAIFVLVFAGVSMAATPTASTNKAICDLVESLGGLLKILRILAFIGAGFTIAGWAYGYLSSGKAELKDVKEKGIGLLVGTFLLFGIGILITFLVGAAGAGGSLGCMDNFSNWGK